MTNGLLISTTSPDTVARLLFMMTALGAALLCSSWTMARAAGEEAPDAIVNVFSDGDAGYPRFRIPVLVALDDNVLLAFAEGRSPTFPGQHDDHAQNDIVLRRSVDGGATWSPVQVVAEMGADSLNDPCAVALPESGRVLLMYQRFPEGYHARRMAHAEMAAPGYGGPDNTQTFMIHSDDSGVTWSAPREITRSVRDEGVVSVGSPGVGIVLSRGSQAGRVLLPLYEVIPVEDAPGEERYWRNRVAISDDQGATWRLGERVPIDGLEGYGNECQLAELANGDIRMNARLQSGANRLAWSVSRNGGESWTSMKEAPELVTTPCMASLISIPVDNDRWLLASLPNSEEGRENGALFISRDGGEHWTRQQTIYPNGFAYSSLALLPDGRIGCLFERGPYEYLSFKAFTLVTPE